MNMVDFLPTNTLSGIEESFRKEFGTKEKSRLLLVEDNKSVRDTLSLGLSSMVDNVELYVASSVREVKAICRINAIFDLVICDHLLGDGTSKDVLETTVARHFMIITGNVADVEGYTNILVMSKPIELRVLAKVVNEYLNGG